jgi:hypothetical protein
MNNDEIANRLINVLKGSAYLIASSILSAGLLVVTTMLVLGYALSDKPHKFSIDLLFIGLPWFLVLLGGAAGLSYYGKRARRFLEREE